MAIKTGDIAMVISGKDKGKKAKVLRVFGAEGRILLEGLNVYKKHERPKKQGQKGQTVERAVPIDVSNVALYCDKCKKGVRVGAGRICLKCKSKL